MIETTSLHQEVLLPLSPHEVYETLLEANRHSSLTGLPCQIDRRPGGTFRVGEGMIEGILLEAVPDQRIVQTWKIASYGWPATHFSRLELELQETREGGTVVILEQTGIPRQSAQFIQAGWYQFYWTPLGAAPHSH